MLVIAVDFTRNPRNLTLVWLSAVNFLSFSRVISAWFLLGNLTWDSKFTHTTEVCTTLNVIMESKGGKTISNRSNYEAPLGFKAEDVMPHGGIEKFRCAAYSDCLRKPS